MASADPRFLPPDRAEPSADYRAALAWIWSFSDLRREHHRPAGHRQAKLDRVQTLMAHLGNPHLAYPTLLVAGTKGKGSTVAMLASVLRASGKSVGRTTSPHLVNWRERVWVDGEPITAGRVIRHVETLRRAVAQLPNALGEPTTFEVGIALAFLDFAERHVDVAVVEVGVGGRFDATNVADPVVSAITPISYDHQSTLGTSLGDIAWHKAGILRAGRAASVGPQPEEARARIREEAHALGTTLSEVGRDWSWSLEAGRRPGAERPHAQSFAVHGVGRAWGELHVELPLLGAHQRDNAATAIAALDLLAAQPCWQISRTAVERGLAAVSWPGRLQVVGGAPTVVLDGAHNEASAAALAAALRESFDTPTVRLVLGATAGKDVPGMLDALAPLASAVYATRSEHERSVAADEVAELTRRLRPDLRVAAVPGLPRALDAARADAGPGEIVLATGSLFLVGEALAHLSLPSV